MASQSVPLVGLEEQLLNPKISTEYSRAFRVPPTHVALVRGVGFLSEAYRPDTTTPAQPQSACLSMLIYKAGLFPQAEGPCRTALYDYNQVAGALEAEELVYIDGCPWSLTACNTMGIITMPGRYRFSLNDPSMATTAGIYLDLYPRGTFVDSLTVPGV